MNKKIKISAIVLGSLGVLAVIAVVLALNSAVQTWAVRKAVAGQPGTKIEVSRVSAGFSEADVNDFQFEQDGMVVTAKGVNAKYSAWDFIRGRGVNADSVSVDDLVVDMRKMQPAGTSKAAAASGTQTPAPSSPPAKPTPFDGLLKQLAVALDVRVGTLDVKGRALLPEDQTVVFNLKGARIETGQQGNLEWTVDFADSKVGAVLRSLKTSGTLAVRITPDRRIDLIAIEGTAAALGPKIPAEQFRLTVRAEQPKVGGDESYAVNLGLVRGANVEPLLKVAAAWTAATREIAGTWEIGLRSEQLAALFTGLGLPEIGADGAGKFALKPDTTAATASGQLTARASQLQKLSPELAAIGSMTLTSRFDGAFADNIARLDALDLDITAANGRKFAQIGLLQKVSFAVKEQRLTLANPQAEAARLSVQALPLAWAQPWLKDLTIESGDLSEVSAIEAEPDGSRVRIRAIEPLTLRNVTIRDAQKKLLVDRVTLSVRPSLDYSATKVIAQLAALSITTPAGDSVTGSLQSEITGLPKAPVVAFSGQIGAKLVTLVKPYLPPGLDLGPLTIADTIEGRLEGKTLSIAKFSTTVSRDGGALLSSIDLLQPVTVNLEKLTFAAATPANALARVRLGEVPLAWGEAFVAKSKISGAFTGTTLEVTARSADDLTIATTAPITIRGATAAIDGKPLAQALDLSASFSATKRGNAVTYELKKVEVKQGDTALATLAVSGEATLGAKLAASAKGSLNADVAALMKQPALAGSATLARGTATADFDANVADAATFTLTFAANDLLAKQGDQPLGTLEGKATATLAADGSGSINAPFTLTNGSRKSDLALNGTFRKAADKVTLDVVGKIDSTNLIVDDFQALAALSPAQAPAPAKPAPTVVRAPRPTAPPASTPPVRDTKPFWHGALGKVEVDLKRVLYGKDAEVRSILCSATIAENTLTLDTLEGKYRETAFKLATKVNFAAAREKPYDLAGSFDVTDFDVGSFLRAANPADDPSVETKVSMLGKFNGNGVNLEDLAQGVYGQFGVTSTKGVLRALSKKSTTGKVISGVSTAANVAVGIWSALGKTPPPQAAAAAETTVDLAKALGELPFEHFSVRVERSADLNFKLTSLEFLSPTMHVTGNGTITRSPSAPNVPLADWPMNVEIQFGAKGGLASLLRATRVLGTATDTKGYTLLREPFPITGTAAKPDSSALWKMIATAAISDGGSAIQSGASALEGLFKRKK